MKVLKTVYVYEGLKLEIVGNHEKELYEIRVNGKVVETLHDWDRACEILRQLQNSY